MAKFTALLSLLLLVVAASTARSQTTTTTFNYDFNGVPPTTLTYGGDAQFLPNRPYLSLTVLPWPTLGRVVHTAPVPFKTGSRSLVSFYSTIKFIITPNNPDNNPGDGIAFFIAPVDADIPSGSFGGRLGIFDADWRAPNTLVVEFDTKPDAEWDPSYPHIGIDIGTIISSNVTNMYHLMVGQNVTADISYFSATERITVRVTLGRAVYEASTVYPLHYLLNDQVQFGLTAATSTGFDAYQEIISWHNNYTVADPPLIQQVVV